MYTENREIKFRAWDRFYRHMIELKDFFHLGDFFSEINDRIDNDVIVMQFTGLKDVDGKEIYEGDIVKATKMKDTIFPVKYNEYNGGFYVAQKFGGFLLNIPEGEYGGGKLIVPWKVIGNIYENPELLK